MRPIKFRAYDADDKVMRSWREIDFAKDIGDDYYLVGYKASAVSTKYDHEQIIMQYTGLKDKNGTEIYEGDIVETPSSKDKYLVDYVEGSFVGRIKYREYTTLYKGLKVIGNIYENPELLEELEE